MSEERVAVVFLSTHSRNVILTANIPILPLSLFSVIEKCVGCHDKLLGSTSSLMCFAAVSTPADDNP